MVLLRHLLEGPGDNVLISPLSAAVALGMAAAGANGPTREGILRTLAHDPANDPLDDLMKLAAQLRDPGYAVALDLVNSLWADRAFRTTRISNSAVACSPELPSVMAA